MYNLKSLSSAGLLLAASFFLGCDKDKPETTGRVPVNLTSNIVSSPLKVAKDQWETADRVGLYMKKVGQPLTASGAVYSDAANVQMSISGGTLTSNPQLMYPETGNVDFIAYHPYTASVDANFTIPVSVAGQASGLPVEVLYANNVVNQAPTASAVTLNFLYSLAKLELTVTGIALTTADFSGMTASIEGMFTQARLQLSNGTFTGHQAKQTIMLHKTGSNATSATFEALVLPVNVTAGDVAFVFNVGGENYRIEPAESYAAATSYALEFKLEPGATAALNKAVIIARNTVPRSYTVHKPGSINTWQIGFPTAESITAQLYSDGTLTIIGTGAMQNWQDCQSTPWKDVINNINRVVINNGVTRIGTFAFSDCLNLTSITLPNSLEHIGNYALQITGLKEIHIDNPIPPTVGGGACFWAVNQSACKLYVPSDSQKSYAAILDWCFFDIVGCDDSCYDIYVQESEHIRIELHQQLVSITSKQLSDWLSNLDRVYEKYAELMGGNTPNEGQKIVIKSVGPEISAWARAVVGGNHIYWNSYCVSETLNAFVNNGDWSFGIMHEMGHNFDKSTEPNWVFHAEITANFKPYYALDVLADCNYDGKFSLQELYDESYFWSLQDDGDDDRLGNKITLGYFNVARKYGWNVIKETFKSYWDNSYPYAGPYYVGSAEKYNEFIDRLEYFSGSSDIRSECFDYGNWLETIERHYPNNKIKTTWEIGHPNAANIIATLDNGTLTISGKGEMYDWGGGGQRPPWSISRESIKKIIINNGVTTIGVYAFIDCTNVVSVNIGKDVHTIKGASFWNCPALIEIYCNNPTPPAVHGDDAFWGVNRTTCKVYVPAGSVSAYQADDIWKKFANIFPF